MTDLWMGFALLVVIAFAFLSIPLVFNLRRGDLVRETANVEIYKSQLADLDREKAAGRISDEDFEALTAEVKRNLLLDTEKSAQSTNHEGGKWIMGVSAVVLVVASVMLYNHLGAENELAIKDLLAKTASPNYKQEDAEELLERLYVQTEQTPEDVEMWYMIGRINFDLGKYHEAVMGFNSVIQHLPPEAKEDQAVALAQLAQAQFFANGRKLDKATESLLEQALEINPRDNTSLGLLGVASYDSGDYINAVRYWQRLLGLMPPNNPNAQAIRGGLDKAMSQLTKDELAILAAEKAASIKSRIEITVDLADSIKSKVPVNSDLFVLAKAEQGPPMPLAVQRIAVSNWPVTVTLDDSMAMMETLKLSEFENVVITARISKNGVGNAKAGDLQGVSGVIKSTDKKTKVIISEELK